jgi:translocation and assembly module TamA
MTVRRRLHALVAVGTTLALLQGCALLGKDKDAAPEQPKLPPPVELVVEAPKPLKALLEAHLDLARLRTVAPTEEISEPELRRLEAAAPAQARALLETEGYFEPTVTVRREPGTPPRVTVLVEPGPQAVVYRFDLDLQGDLARAIASGDAKARALQSALETGWPLPVGSGFRNAVWSTGKTATLAQTRAAGYAAASLAGSAADVDAVAHRVRLQVLLDSGPLFKVGEINVLGLDRQDPVTVRNLANVQPGTPATEALLLDFQERLQRSGLYEQISVELDPDPQQAATATVTVRLREQPLQQATVGLGISADTGARASLEHIHRRVFGLRATARNKFELGQQRQAWEGELSTHAQPGLYRNLVGGSLERVESAVDVVTSSKLRVGRSLETPRTDRYAFVQWERALVRSDTLNEQGDALSLNYHAVWRRVDDLLLPTKGVSLSLQTAIGVASSNSGASGPFARVYGRFNYWRPIGDTWYGQARIELGQVFVRGAVEVPETRRFRAGGDDSVRGYGYRTLGPVVGGGVVSGDVLFTASAEVARPVSASLPSVWWAVFVDAGQAANEWRALKPGRALACGPGVR